MIKKIFLISLFILGLIYVLWPGVTHVNQLPPLENSLKSEEPYDTYLLPNITAYFSYTRREELIDLYKNSYQGSYCQENALKVINPFCYLKPVRVNRDMLESYTYIRDQMLTTYLEEYSYPLKNTLFINGYEPYDIHGNKFPGRAAPIIINNTLYDTKTTLRLYQPSVIAQIFIYLGIWIAVIGLYQVSKRALKETIQ